MLKDKSKIIYFLMGTILGIFLTLSFFGIAYVGYKVGKNVLFATEPAQAKVVRKISGKVVRKGSFNLGFENSKDLDFFELKDGVFIEQSNDFATQGKYSLLVEYPKGATYPGLFWEVYNKGKCLDWSGNQYFSFDVYNNSEENITLEIKLKSGENYPKKVYQIPVNITAQSSKNVTMSVNDLKGYLDVRQISYINLFINNPQKTVVLYFDNMHVG